MGWFDDDDEDDEEEDRKPKSFLAMTSTLSHGVDADEEEDPLDAYMKKLNDSNANEEEKKKEMPQSERLDVENEEEATSHWKASSPEATKEAAEDQPNEAKLAMQTTFHKATDHQKQELRQVDIQLEKVQHSSMGYSEFKKVLLPDGTNATSSSSGHAWRQQHSIMCVPPLEPIWDFAELRDVFPEAIMEWISTNGFEKPTLVQSQTLGVALRGKDAIITASTGSGKTLAYLWPLATHLIENQKQSRALVLVPTRELALQVEKVAKSLFRNLPFSSLAIIGGNMGRYQLSQALVKTKPHLIVATPGRLLDVLSSQQKAKQNWLLTEITFLVLDEADKMLQLGFAPQVSQVLESLRPDRQSLLTSATLNQRLERHCREWMNAPTRISIGRTGRSSEHVEQHVICLPNQQAKESFLKEMLPTFCEVGRTLVFCATRDGCEALGQALLPILPTVTLHGDKHQNDRKAALKAFTKGQVKLLVATDVAGRGLDIPEVGTVINFDPAKNWDAHVHRIGRAGRLTTEKQQSGTAYTLLQPSNADFAHVLVQAYTREQRPISDDLRALARRSKQNGGGGGSLRKATNKSGLGFNHYGPVDDAGKNQPPAKKSRWS
jgi:ATP-dependent RNA helicase DDX42